MAIFVKGFWLLQQMRREERSQCMDDVSARVTFLPCHVLFGRPQFVHGNYLQCLSALLCANRKETSFFNLLKRGGTCYFNLGSYLIVLTGALNWIFVYYLNRAILGPKYYL